MFRRSAQLSLPLALFLAGNAAAAPSSQDTAVASRLFDDAAKLMASDRPDEACPKYAESQRFDPQLGTLLHLAECYAKVGKTASAWASFKDASELAEQRNDPREAKIRERLASAEKALSSIVITIAPSQPTDLEIRQDGQVVGKAAWGSPLPLDPGKHEITAAGTGRKAWTAVIQVPADGTTTNVNVPTLEVVPAPEAAPLAPAANPIAPSAPSTVGDDTTAAGSSSSTERVLGWSAIGAGAAGLAIGVVFELKKSSELSDRDAICPTTQCQGLPTDPVARKEALADNQTRINQLTSDARTASTVAAIGFVAGGVLAAGGIVLLFTAPRGESHTAFAPMLAPGFQGAMVQHVW